MSFEDSVKLTYAVLKQLQVSLRDTSTCDSPHFQTLVYLIEYLETSHGKECLEDTEAFFSRKLNMISIESEPTDANFDTTLLKECPENYGDIVSLLDFLNE